MKKKRTPRLLEGLPVVDGTRKVILNVNKNDVKNAKKKDPSSCAAALAGQRELHKEVRVYLTRTYIKDNDKKQWVRYLTPMSAQKEIISFDRGSEFCPGSYVLKPAQESQKLGSHRGRSFQSDGSKNKRNTAHTTANVRDWKERK